MNGWVLIEIQIHWNPYILRPCTYNLVGHVYFFVTEQPQLMDLPVLF